MRGSSRRNNSRFLPRLVLFIIFLWICFALLRPGPSKHPLTSTLPPTSTSLPPPSSSAPTINSEDPPLPPRNTNVIGSRGLGVDHQVTNRPVVQQQQQQQSAGGVEGSRDDGAVAEVVAALKHSWQGYKRNAFGYDEFLPISKRRQNWGDGRGIGVTMIDALDTLLLAGLDKEADEVMNYIEHSLSFDQNIKVSLFETTIRVLGGLISAFQMTQREGLKRQAKDLGSRLLRAFETPSGIPDNYVNLQTGAHEGAGWNGGAAILSELGSLQMEFAALSDITGDRRYDAAAQKAVAAIQHNCASGFCSRNYHGTQGMGGFAGLGSFGDSYYEYLLKYWLLTGKRDSAYREMWDRAARHILDTTDRTAPLVVPNGRETGNTMEHLACFSGGLFALSYLTDGNKEHLELAKQIAETCHAMYQSSVTKLSPDVAQIHGTQVHSTESKFILRPETVETYFYLWRATHDTKYRQWGLEMLRACDRYLKVEDGFVGTRDVFSEHGSKNDMLETFWFAETLKYLYLLFREDAALSLTQKVFNTEAHPFLVHPAP